MYGRGIDRSHELRRRLAHHVAMHGFEIGDYSIGKPTVRRYCDSKLKVGRYCSIAEGVIFVLGGIHRTDTVTTSLLELMEDFATRERDVLYFANCDPNETLIYRIHRWLAAGDRIEIEESLSRKGDGLRMARTVTMKERRHSPET